MKGFLQRIKYLLKYTVWVLNGYLGKVISIQGPQKVTILLTPYSPIRMNDLGTQVRNILKCSFVEKIVISNHNPQVKIEDKLNISNDRVVCVNQDVRRASGYRWRVVANTLEAEYLIVMDDDILLFPSQLKLLFERLVLEPAIPHGFSGILDLGNDELEYREREDMEVDYLCELYAVTKNHVKQYVELERLITEQDATLSETIERFGDFVVISQTAGQNPKIHKLNRFFRSETFKTPGIATHKDGDFGDAVKKVCHAVKEVKAQSLVSD